MSENPTPNDAPESEIRRYDMKIGMKLSGGFVIAETKWKLGEWVRYEDHLATNTSLRSKIEELEARPMYQLSNKEIADSAPQILLMDKEKL